MVEEANNEQVSTGLQSDIFYITMPFDNGIIFKSPADANIWITKEVNLFSEFINYNTLYLTNSNDSKDAIAFPVSIKEMIDGYYVWHDKIKKIVGTIISLKNNDALSNRLDVLEETKGKLIQACDDFSNNGYVPMQSSIGACAMSMSKILRETTPRQHSKYFENTLQQGIAWLYAMTVLKRQQIEHQPKIKNIEKKIADDEKLLESLEGQITNSQNKIKLYEEKIEAFRLKGLKAAALIAPADALTSLEAVHAKAAKFYFGVAGATVLVWILFTIFCYYPYYVKPLLEKIKEMPLEAGAMILLTSMAFTGIMLTLAVILLRLAVSRVNFSVAAGERKTIATAYRALLSENAISNDQQLIFLQSIVGRNFPGYVDSNGIPTLQDTLGSAAKNLRGGDTSDG